MDCIKCCIIGTLHLITICINGVFFSFSRHVHKRQPREFYFNCWISKLEELQRRIYIINDNNYTQMKGIGLLNQAMHLTGSSLLLHILYESIPYNGVFLQPPWRPCLFLLFSPQVLSQTFLFNVCLLSISIVSSARLADPRGAPLRFILSFSCSFL